jgi:hypothetical protein
LPISDSDIVSLPDVALSPLQFPDAEQLFALVVDQVKVNVKLTSTLWAEVDKVIVGEGETGVADKSILLLLSLPHPDNTVRNNKQEPNREQLLNIRPTRLNCRLTLLFFRLLIVDIGDKVIYKTLLNLPLAFNQ